MGHATEIDVHALIETQRSLLQEDGVLRLVGSRCVGEILRKRLATLSDREIAGLFVSVRRILYHLGPERLIADEAERRLARSEAGALTAGDDGQSPQFLPDNRPSPD